MNFSIKDFFSKSDQVRISLQIWLHLLKKSLMENFIFRAMNFLLIEHSKTLKLEHLNISSLCVNKKDPGNLRNAFAKVAQNIFNWSNKKTMWKPLVVNY